MHKVFVSFFGGDEDEVLEFVEKWCDGKEVFRPIILHDAYNGLFVDSEDPEYVIGRIRKDFIADSTVTLLLLGSCTHSRRYVDWELKASLRQGDLYTPNGLLAVSLESAPKCLDLPPRFEANWDECHDGSAYAKWYRPPTSSRELAGWIEEAFRARSTRAHLIRNYQERMLYNRKCLVHGFTH